ncbi:hypothetical protein [Aureimonas frigidaquae]|uniref:hypothetical protein n=1 Tax=Aureimonas frigidaquae TaxID=424757 RepID=UPI000783135E|nr:hypothetical protein [Aureimonas frigidaquae]
MQLFQPVTSVAEFRSLDEGDVLCGYLDGLSGQPCILSEVSRAYWHGWRNGLVDGGFTEPDDAQKILDAAFAALRG